MWDFSDVSGGLFLRHRDTMKPISPSDFGKAAAVVGYHDSNYSEQESEDRAEYASVAAPVTTPRVPETKSGAPSGNVFRTVCSKPSGKLWPGIHYTRST